MHPRSKEYRKLFRQHKKLSKIRAIEWLEILATSKYAFHIDEYPHDIYIEILEESQVKKLFTESQANNVHTTLNIIAKLIDWDDVWRIYYKALKKNKAETITKVKEN